MNTKVKKYHYNKRKKFKKKFLESIMISIIIPNYNGLNFLNECFESLRDQNCSFKVIIIDNGSDDGSLKFIRENYPEFTLIENRDNLGFSVAVNQGIKAATTKYVFLLNNDVVLEPDCISNLLKCIMNDDHIFAVASKMVQYHDRSKLDDAGDEYTLLGWTKKVGDGKSSKLYTDKRDIFSACAGAALYRRSVFDSISYFDENFFAYMEDVDISYRARIYGYKCIYCPDAVVYHRVSETSGNKYNEFKIKLAARNNVYVPYKNMPRPQFLVNIIFLFLGYFIKYLFFLKRGQGKFYLDGLKEGFNSLDKIEKLKYDKNNLVNYFIIEWFLIRNTFKLIYY
jgi:GT2 family glycosyltransferase